MKIKFNLTWKNVLIIVGTLTWLNYVYYFFETKGEVLVNLLRDILELVSISSFNLFTKILLMNTLIFTLILTPIMLFYVIVLLLPKSKKEQERKKLIKEFERNWEIKRYENKLIKIKRVKNGRRKNKTKI